MADTYMAYTLTTAGEDIMARVVAGLQIQFKRLAIGDGFDYNTENFKSRTALVNEVAQITDLTMVVSSENLVKITGKLTQSDIQRSFYNRELGLFIVDPDDETKEILYAYGNKNDLAEYLTPDVSNYGIEKEFEIYVKVGKSANVNIYITSTHLTTEVLFDEEDWILNDSTGYYELILGMVNEVLKIYRTTSEGRRDTNLVGVNVADNVSKLVSMIPFTGSAITI